MKCYVCNQSAHLIHLTRSICQKCFLKNMEKRVKRHLGRNKFQKNDLVLVTGELEHYLLKKSIQGLPLKIIYKKTIPKNTTKFKHIIIGKTLDHFNEEFLTALFQGKINQNQSKKFFNILEPLTDQEITQYAKLREIKYHPKKRINLAQKLFQNLNQFTELRYNLYKNIKELKEKVLI